MIPSDFSFWWKGFCKAPSEAVGEELAELVWEAATAHQREQDAALADNFVMTDGDHGTEIGEAIRAQGSKQPVAESKPREWLLALTEHGALRGALEWQDHFKEHMTENSVRVREVFNKNPDACNEPGCAHLLRWHNRGTGPCGLCGCVWFVPRKESSDG